MDINTVILAAGKGTRMKSAKAKVLHELGGKTMLQHVVESVTGFNSRVSVVYGHDGVQVKSSLDGFDICWVEQTEQLGTGHAVQQAVDQINDDDIVIILYGDVPLTQHTTLAKLVEVVDENGLGLLTVTLDDSTGYGRIVREAGIVQRIVEQKDASSEQLLIKEVNTGIMAVKGNLLKGWLKQLKSNNAQSEYYLTDIIEMAVKDGVVVNTVEPKDAFEVQGVNSKVQLNELERHFQKQQAINLLEQGVTLADVNRVDIRGKLSIQGQEVYIDVNNVFEGNVNLGGNVHIGPNCLLQNVSIADGVTIKANSVLEDCTVGSGSVIGPFARLRPGSELQADVRIGNFVEVKKTTLGKGSKVNHLSYIGDAEIGQGVNIGAGTITCNYDGVNKHKTQIEDDAFIGSGTQLIAPVTVGKGATIGAGTTLSRNAVAEALTLTRAKQVSISAWKKPTKN